MVTARGPSVLMGVWFCLAGGRRGHSVLMVTSAVSEDRVVSADKDHPPQRQCLACTLAPSGMPWEMRTKLGFPMDSLVTSGVLTAPETMLLVPALLADHPPQGQKATGEVPAQRCPKSACRQLFVVTQGT